ncbi:hypothetical protein HYW36_01225 [Candidatus Saccharibacteria bacterium]|nr:hypothetical protein [Candidatus Saccharibacteria bacterium]
MIKIDTDLLEELGLTNLTIDQKNDTIESIKHALDERVGDRAIDSLTDDQVEELEKKMMNGSAEDTAEWLQKTVPNYKNIVDDVLEKIKNEVKSQGISAVTAQDTDSSQ